MKRKLFQHSVLLLILCIVIASCEQLGLTGSDDSIIEDTSTVNQIVDTVIPKYCKASSIHFHQEIDRFVALTYDSSRLVKSVTTIKDDQDIIIEVSYIYREDSKLDRLITIPDSLITNYIYNEDGMLTAIHSNNLKQEFTYNEADLIIKQSSLYKDKMYMYNEYSYDSTGLPVLLNRYNKNGELSAAIEIVYDDKENPLKGLTGKINSSEMIFGYPVGNCAHNPVKMTTTFHEKTQWKKEGVYKNPGDKEVVVIDIRYNEDNYPMRIIASTDTIDIQYQCE